MKRVSRCSMMLLLLVGASVGGTGCGGGDSEKSVTTIKVAGPASLTGSYATISPAIINGAKAAMAWLEQQDGFAIGKNARGTIELLYDDDASLAENVSTITTAFVADPTVNFIMAPYSSGLTTKAAEITVPASKLLLISGGASNSLYAAGSQYLVASIGLGSEYHKGILDAIKQKIGTLSTLKIGFLYEDETFSQSVKKAAVEYAGQLGLSTVFNYNYTKSAKETDPVLVAKAAELAALNPDLILGGGHSGDGRALTKLLYNDGARPKALSLLVAPAESEFYDLVKACPAPCDHATHPAEGVSGPSHWEVGVGFDSAAAKESGLEWYGPTQEEFLILYQMVAGGDQVPSYHSANGAVMILSLALAIQKAGSVETEAVASAFHLLNFMSFWGIWGIDETGANTGHKMVEAQWQQGEKQIVWPLEGKTSELVYPIH